MKWIITEDHVNGTVPMAKDGCLADKMVPITSVGPGSAVGRNPTDKIDSDARLREYANELPCEFQLLDDDDNLYFVGRCSDLSQQDANSAFEPLDRLGAVYGCTTMMYRAAGNSLAAWEQL